MNPLLHLHRRHAMLLSRQGPGRLVPEPAHPRVTGIGLPAADDGGRSGRAA